MEPGLVGVWQKAPLIDLSLYVSASVFGGSRHNLVPLLGDILSIVNIFIYFKGADVSALNFQMPFPNASLMLSARAFIYYFNLLDC
jgi:hypothetical protein